MEHPRLTALDRCDRCGAAAVARTMHTKGTLLWCRHHLTEHEEPLTPHLVTYLAQSQDEIAEGARA